MSIWNFCYWIFFPITKKTTRNKSVRTKKFTLNLKIDRPPRGPFLFSWKVSVVHRKKNTFDLYFSIKMNSKSGVCVVGNVWVRSPPPERLVTMSGGCAAPHYREVLHYSCNWAGQPVLQWLVACLRLLMLEWRRPLPYGAGTDLSSLSVPTRVNSNLHCGPVRKTRTFQSAGAGAGGRELLIAAARPGRRDWSPNRPPPAPSRSSELHLYWLIWHVPGTRVPIFQEFSKSAIIEIPMKQGQ